MDNPLIMVVDDDKVVADSIANTIKDTKRYDVITAYSAKEALDNLSKNKIMLGLRGNRIRLVFLDIKMPDMDGLQLLEKIRKDYGDQVAVTMLTAYEDEEKWNRATSGFVINYIKKPFDEKDLIGTLDKFFAGKEGEMVMRTFEKALDKKEELKKTKP